MFKFKLTSPGVLLILAVLAAGGIFLLDVYFLHPHVDAQKWAALREEAVRAERATQLALRDEQEDLLRTCGIWAGDGRLAAALSQPAAGAIQALAARIGQAADADWVWIDDSAGRAVVRWRRTAAGDGSQPATAPASPARPAAGDATPGGGLIELPDGLAVFARHGVAAEGQGAQRLGRLLLGRSIDARWLERIGAGIGAELAVVPAIAPDRRALAATTASHVAWLGKEDSLIVAWPARGKEGEALGYFRATVPVVHIHRQAAASRRMVLIIVSLSVGLSLLVILGSHMLVTGPVMRLLMRLQRLEAGNGTPESLVRDLHGEPLMLARRLESAFVKLAHISKTDPLTGLANRRHFEEVLQCFYHQARRYNRPLSVIEMDIDFFKVINDAGGHQTGDEVLRKVSAAVESACRKADLPARYGGDEFAILLPETAADQAEAVAERISAAVAAQSVQIKNAQFSITVSMGVADLNAGEMGGPGAMMSLADKALYTAKQFGRNRIVQAHDLHSVSVREEQEESGRIDTLSRKLAGLDTQFKDLFLQAIQEVMDILQQRDPHMADHSRKIQHYARLIAAEMGLSERVIQRIEIAAMMHDIGMLALPDSILLCPTKLDLAQVRTMRRHPLLSVRIMERMEFLEQEIPAVRYHHERFDGRGYPEGISGASIPLTARILAVADVFDALTSPRPFRDARHLPDALAEIRQASGTQFDPAVVEAFLAVAERLGQKLLEVPGVKPLSAPQEARSAASGIWRFHDPAEVDAAQR